MAIAAQRTLPPGLTSLALAYIAWGYGNKLLPVSNDSVTFWALAVGPDLFFLGVLLYAHISRHVPGELYYLEPPRNLRQFFLDCLLCYAVFVAIALFLHYPIGVIGDIARYVTGTRELIPAYYETKAYQSVPGHWNTLLMACTLVAGSISEEVVYRGMLRRLIDKRTVYIVGSSLLFACPHINQGLNAVLVAFVFGVAACALLIHLRALLPLVAGHIAVNLTVLTQH